MGSPVPGFPEAGRVGPRRFILGTGRELVIKGKARRQEGTTGRYQLCALAALREMLRVFTGLGLRDMAKARLFPAHRERRA